MSQNLFKLVKTLTANEKGYIKKASIKSSKGLLYGQILDYLAKQSSYDDQKFKKKFEQQTGSNISKYKADLVAIIQKRLAQFHEETNVELKLKAMLNQGIVLHKKGLFDLAIIQYEKTLKLAFNTEENQVALECLNRLYSIYYTGQMGTTFPHKETYKALIQKIEQENLIYPLNGSIAEVMFTDHLSEQKMVDEVKRIQKESKALGEPLGFMVNWGQQCITTHSNYLLKDHQRADVSKQHQLQFLQDHPVMHQKDPLRYVKHLINYINGKFNIGAYSEIPKLLKELENIQIESGLNDYINNLKWTCFYIHSITYNLHSGDFEKAHQLILKANDWFTKNQTSDYFSMLFYEVAFVCYFGKGELKIAQEQLNTLYFYQTSFRKELQLAVQFYFIIVHFELEHYDLVASKSKSHYRLLLKNHPHLSSSASIIKWLKTSFNKIANKKDFSEKANQILADLNAIKEEHPLMYIPFLKAWLISKGDPKQFQKAYSEYFIESK